MSNDTNEALSQFFSSLNDMSADELTALVETRLDDEGLDLFVRHIEEFYGIEEEEELGTLAQIMVVGYLAALAQEGKLKTTLRN